MARTNRPKTFHYRYVDDLTAGRDLETRLRQVLFDSHKRIKDRWEDLSLDDEDVQINRLINIRHRSSSMVGGVMLLFESGKNEEVLRVNENQEELETEQVAPPETEQGEQREFIASRLYFGVHGNHVVVVQSQQLTARDLENHLRWLLDEQAGILEPTETLALKQGLSIRGTEALKHPKELRVGVPVFDHSTDGDSGQASAAGSPIQARFEMGLQLLRSALGQDALDHIHLEQYENADDLYVELLVKRKGRTSDEEDDPGRQAMEAVTGALRHQHPEDIRIITDKMGEVRGDNIYLSRRINVVHWNGVADYSDIFHRMHDWILECLEHGYINPE